MRTFLRRTGTAVVGLALAASATVGADLPAQAAAGCSATFAGYQTITRGSTGAQAAAAECLLTRAGFTVSRNASISTSDAAQIVKFRRSVGLDPVRALGGRGWSALIAQGDTPTLRAGSRGADVLRLQLALRAGGFSGVPSTSTLDAATVKVLKSAQKTHRLTQTGTTTARTWKLLQSGDLVVRKTAHKKTVTTAARSSSKGTKALAFAKKQVGDRYRYGAAGPGAWDCSGLTMKAWATAKVKLPHSSKGQYSRGKKVSKSNLRKGDLVFFYSGPSHVGIYAGDGKIVHASRPGKPVHSIKMKYMPYKGARRPG